jgi:rhamnulose-1-phosphate aldolase
MIDLVAMCPALAPWLERMTAVSAYLWQKGWAERNAGNLSIDVTACVADAAMQEGSSAPLAGRYAGLAGRAFLVTGSGRRFRDLAGDAVGNACILRMTDAGYVRMWGGEGVPGFRPTSEFPAHLRVHEYLRESGRPEGVVLHTHPTELIALTHFPEYKTEKAINHALWGMHPEVKFAVPRGVGFVPYEVPGSEALALASAAAFRRGHSVALWEMHGAVAIGEGVMEAFDLIDTLNKAARILLACRAAGCVPQGLTQPRLDELVRTFDLKE